MPSEKEFKLNENITQKLEGKKTKLHDRVYNTISTFRQDCGVAVGVFQREEYSTLEFIEDILSEFTRISPRKWIVKTGKNVGYIKETIISTIFMEKSRNYITTHKNYIKNGENIDFFFNLDVLDTFEKNVDEYFGEKAQDIIRFINQYRTTNPNLKEYTRQQYHIHNPNLDGHYFDIIDTVEKAYWFGFLRADGWISTRRGKYEIGIQLSIKDKDILEKFAIAISIDPSKVTTRPSMTLGKTHTMAQLIFNCKPMLLALKRQGFTNSKIKMINIPKFVNIKNGPTSRQLLLAFLRGYYDGDGHSGSSRIGSLSKPFLVQVRHALGLKFPVEKEQSFYVYFDAHRKHHVRRSFYHLFVGGYLFNEMSLICKVGRVPTLERKDNIFSMREQSLEILEAKLEILGLDKSGIQELVYEYAQYKLVKVIDESFIKLGLKTPRYLVLSSYSTSVWTFNLLKEKWNIILPPRGYWHIGDKDNYLGQR